MSPEDPNQLDQGTGDVRPSDTGMPQRAEGRDPDSGSGAPAPRRGRRFASGPRRGAPPETGDASTGDRGTEITALRRTLFHRDRPDLQEREQHMGGAATHGTEEPTAPGTEGTDDDAPTQQLGRMRDEDEHTRPLRAVIDPATADQDDDAADWDRVAAAQRQAPTEPAVPQGSTAASLQDGPPTDIFRPAATLDQESSHEGGQRVPDGEEQSGSEYEPSGDLDEHPDDLDEHPGDQDEPTITRARPEMEVAAREQNTSTAPRGLANPDQAAGDPHRSFGGSVGWTVLGTIIPGLGFWKTRWRPVGLLIAALFVLGAGALVLWALGNKSQALQLAVRPAMLRMIGITAVVGALVWVLIIVSTHLLTRPRRLLGWQRAAGALVVALLSFAVAAPMAVAARLTYDQYTFVSKVFGGTHRSQTRPSVNTNQNSTDFWAAKPRINILMVGLDDSAERNYKKNADESTDSMMIASVDTQTGNTILIQLPRNLSHPKFPEGSDLAKVYPDGFHADVDPLDGDAWLNSVWAHAPSEHPELFKNTDYPGADALKLAMQGITGLTIDYFAAVNIDSMQAIINAMGGITLNVNVRIPINGNSEGKQPTSYIEVGPNQHLDGYHALWYARSRSAEDDYARMRRQSCVVNGIIDQADPQTLVTHYDKIVKASGDAVQTDIPQEMLPHLVDLAMRMKGGNQQRVIFEHGKNGYSSNSPNFELMQQQITAAIQKQSQKNSSPAATSHPATTAAPSPSAKPTATSSSSPSPTTSKENPQEQLADACAYHPQK